MTFKHGKFEDSVVMRSLERLEKEKNPVSPQIFKSAAPTLNLTPTPSLVENVLHLCIGLRQTGLSKFADEVESNFLQYKQAQTIYETSTETGEDLVDQAHPKGSHKLEDVDSTEAVFKTIVDKHLETVKMIEKKPTGKLSEAYDIIKAVKIVFADETSDLITAINVRMGRVRAIMAKLDEVTADELTLALRRDNSWSTTIELTNHPTQADNLRKIKKYIDGLGWRLKPGTILGLSEESWAKTAPYWNAAERAITEAISYNDKLNRIESEKRAKEFEDPEPEAPKALVMTNTNAVKKKATQALNRLDVLSKLVQISQNPTRKARAAQWIATKKQQIEQIMNAVSSAGEGTPHGEEVATAILPELTPLAEAVEKASFKP